MNYRHETIGVRLTTFSVGKWMNSQTNKSKTLKYLIKIYDFFSDMKIVYFV